MRGTGRDTTMCVAAFAAALVVACWASYRQCPERHIPSHDAINYAISSTVENTVFTNHTELRKMWWGHFAINIRTHYLNTGNVLQPFTPYCKGVHTAVYAEFELSGSIKLELAFEDGEDLLGSAGVHFHKTIAKVQFHVNASPNNETFTLYPAHVLLMRPAAIVAYVEDIRPRDYLDVARVFLNPLMKLYSDEVLNWYMADYALQNVLARRANEMAPFDAKLQFTHGLCG